MKKTYTTNEKALLAFNIFGGIVSVIALLSLVIRFGFPFTATQLALSERADLLILLFFLVQLPIRTFLSEDPRDYLKSHWFQVVVALVLVLYLTYAFSILRGEGLSQYFDLKEMSNLTNLTVFSTQGLLVLSLLSGALHLNKKVAALKFHPAQTTFLTFSGIIFFGAGCLMMPLCREPGNVLSFLDAVFTATSATCVTGLTVVDTGSFFTMRGQMVILVLIQVGGLGLMTLSSFLAMFFAGGVGIRERVLLMDVLNVSTMEQISVTLRRMILLTLMIELLGSFVLFVFWHDRPWPVGDRYYYALFHSVSAFCNAGFSLFPDSLMSEHSPLVILTFCGLIIAGGLGFTTLSELGHLRQPKRGTRRFTLQTKLVLWTSGLLLVFGTLAIFLIQPMQCEWPERLMHAFFAAVTARTAGFNTVDFAAFNLAAVWVMLVLMFIGASPGSTGGGLKTSTLAVLFLRMWATLRGKNRIMLGYRNLPMVVANRALVIFSFSISLLAIITFSLLLIENGPLEDILFEAISAFSTTGLSRGLTGRLSEAGKLVICLAMFAGRLGPLTLAFAITAPKDSYPIEYPDESVTVG